MVLLAAEGLRPGSLGNLAIDDFKYEAGSAGGYVEIKDNVPRRQAPVRTNTPKAKGARSTFVPYASNVTVKLWPFTCLAIKQYIDGERVEVLGRHLKNRSKSFLFVADHGGPITDRTTIAVVFCRLESRLRELGLLTRGQPETLTHAAPTMTSVPTRCAIQQLRFFTSQMPTDPPSWILCGSALVGAPAARCRTGTQTGP